jgi:L-aminopeptidase/D-esterase-like protein
MGNRPSVADGAVLGVVGGGTGTAVCEVGGGTGTAVCEVGGGTGTAVWVPVVAILVVDGDAVVVLCGEAAA